MKFRIFARLEYAIQPPATLFFCFRAQSTRRQTIEAERVQLPTSEVSQELTVGLEGNRMDKVIARSESLFLSYEAEVEARHDRVDASELQESLFIEELDPRLVTYLVPSRYCQSDLLTRFSWQKFGGYKTPYEKVAAITEWIHGSIEYLPGSTHSGTSAYDTVTQMAGVCRDFAHLGIALCRALSIPARYVAAYAHRLEPQDFHACMEVWLGGRWIVFDPTRLAPLNGLVRIGAGRDAADVSVCTAFGAVTPKLCQVGCEVEDADFQALDPTEPAAVDFSGERPD